MKRTLHVPQESLIRIFINGTFFSAVLCTPRDLKELAVGWLYTQGVIESLNEVASVGACEDLSDIRVQVTSDRYRERGRDHMIRTSACMGGHISYEHFLLSTRTPVHGPKVSLTSLKSLMKKALVRARSYHVTGGIHWACIASSTNAQPWVLFEDVGRHNAVDKAIGGILLHHHRLDGSEVMLTSGRLSSEMVLKTARIGIPILASITTSTDLGVRLAEASNLTLIGRLLSHHPVIWSGSQRILT